MNVRIAQTTHAPPSSNASEKFWQQLIKQNRHSRRSHPRVHADISVHVLGIEDQPIKLHCQDISFGGLQLRCCPETSQRLLRLKLDALTGPDQPSTNAVDSIARMNLEIRLVVNGKVRKILTLARVAHFVHIPDALPGQEIAIGFQFLGFKDRGKSLLTRFVEEHLIPAGF